MRRRLAWGVFGLLVLVAVSSRSLGLPAYAALGVLVGLKVAPHAGSAARLGGRNTL